MTRQKKKNQTSTISTLDDLEEDHISDLQKRSCKYFYPEHFTYFRYSKIFQAKKSGKGFFPAWALRDNLLLPRGKVAQGMDALGLKALKGVSK